MSDNHVDEVKLYKDIKKYKDKVEVVENTMTHLDLKHAEIYSKNAQEVLETDDPSQKDLNKLKKSEHQKKLGDGMADDYVRMIKKKWSKYDPNVEKWDLDEFDEALFMGTLVDTTREKLNRYIAAEKDSFSQKKFMDHYAPRFMKEIRGRLEGAAGQHITDDHTGAILNLTVEKGLIDKIKDYIDRDKSLLFLRQYKGQKMGAQDLINIDKDFKSETKGQGELLPDHVVADLEKKLEEEKKKKLEKLAS